MELKSEIPIKKYDFFREFENKISQYIFCIGKTHYSFSPLIIQVTNELKYVIINGLCPLGIRNNSVFIAYRGGGLDVDYEIQKKWGKDFIDYIFGIFMNILKDTHTFFSIGSNFFTIRKDEMYIKYVIGLSIIYNHDISILLYDKKRSLSIEGKHYSKIYELQTFILNNCPEFFNHKDPILVLYNQKIYFILNYRKPLTHITLKENDEDIITNCGKKISIEVEILDFWENFIKIFEKKFEIVERNYFTLLIKTNFENLEFKLSFNLDDNIKSLDTLEKL
jgi:hypothetical protein